MSLFILLIGLIIGSFLNVCIYRIPRGQSIVWPGSHCPHCREPLKLLDLVPVLSHLFFKGRCRYCRGGISIRYPLIESLTGIIFLLLYLKYDNSPEFWGAAVLSALLIPVFFIDLEHLIIPNSIILTGLVLGILLHLFIDYQRLPFYLGGSLTGFLLLLAVAVFSKGGMGMGDVKLGAMIGIFLGPQKVVLAIFMAACMASVVGFGLILFAGKTGKHKMPFGTFMAVAALLTFIWGDRLIDTYIDLMWRM